MASTMWSTSVAPSKIAPSSIVVLLLSSLVFCNSFTTTTALSSNAGIIPADRVVELSQSLRDSIQNAGLYETPLRKILFEGIDGGITGDESLIKEYETSQSLRDVAIEQSGTFGSIAFIVRRPG